MWPCLWLFMALFEMSQVRVLKLLPYWGKIPWDTVFCVLFVTTVEINLIRRHTCKSIQSITKDDVEKCTLCNKLFNLNCHWTSICAPTVERNHIESHVTHSACIVCGKLAILFHNLTLVLCMPSCDISICFEIRPNSCSEKFCSSVPKFHVSLHVIF